MEQLPSSIRQRRVLQYPCFILMSRLPERDYEQPKRIRDELIGSSPRRGIRYRWRTKNCAICLLGTSTGGGFVLRDVLYWTDIWLEHKLYELTDASGSACLNLCQSSNLRRTDKCPILLAKTIAFRSFMAGLATWSNIGQERSTLY